MVTPTAQSLQDSVAAIQAAKTALEQLNTAAQTLQTSAGTADGFSPVTLAVAAGPLLAHAIKDIMPKVPNSLRPMVAMLGMAGATTAAAVSKGTPLSTALGYGLVTALAGTGWHLAVLKDGGLLGALQGVVQGLQAQPLTPLGETLQKADTVKSAAAPAVGVPYAPTPVPDPKAAASASGN